METSTVGENNTTEEGQVITVEDTGPFEVYSDEPVGDAATNANELAAEASAAIHAPPGKFEVKQAVCPS